MYSPSADKSGYACFRRPMGHFFLWQHTIVRMIFRSPIKKIAVENKSKVQKINNLALTLTFARVNYGPTYRAILGSFTVLPSGRLRSTGGTTCVFPPMPGGPEPQKALLELYLFDRKFLRVISVLEILSGPHSFLCTI